MDTADIFTQPHVLGVCGEEVQGELKDICAAPVVAAASTSFGNNRTCGCSDRHPNLGVTAEAVEVSCPPQSFAAVGMLEVPRAQGRHNPCEEVLLTRASSAPGLKTPSSHHAIFPPCPSTGAAPSPANSNTSSPAWITTSPSPFCRSLALRCCAALPPSPGLGAPLTADKEESDAEVRQKSLSSHESLLHLIAKAEPVDDAGGGCSEDGLLWTLPCISGESPSPIPPQPDNNADSRDQHHRDNSDSGNVSFLVNCRSSVGASPERAPSPQQQQAEEEGAMIATDTVVAAFSSVGVSKEAPESRGETSQGLSLPFIARVNSGDGDSLTIMTAPAAADTDGSPILPLPLLPGGGSRRVSRWQHPQFAVALLTPRSRPSGSAGGSPRAAGLSVPPLHPLAHPPSLPRTPLLTPRDVTQPTPLVLPAQAPQSCVQGLSELSSPVSHPSSSPLSPSSVGQGMPPPAGETSEKQDAAPPAPPINSFSSECRCTDRATSLRKPRPPPFTTSAALSGSLSTPVSRSSSMRRGGRACHARLGSPPRASDAPPHRPSPHPSPRSPSSAAAAAYSAAPALRSLRRQVSEIGRGDTDGSNQKKSAPPLHGIIVLHSPIALRSREPPTEAASNEDAVERSGDDNASHTSPPQQQQQQQQQPPMAHLPAPSVSDGEGGRLEVPDAASHGGTDAEAPHRDPAAALPHDTAVAAPNVEGGGQTSTTATTTTTTIVDAHSGGENAVVLPMPLRSVAPSLHDAEEEAEAAADPLAAPLLSKRVSCPFASQPPSTAAEGTPTGRQGFSVSSILVSSSRSSLGSSTQRGILAAAAFKSTSMLGGAVRPVSFAGETRSSCSFVALGSRRRESHFSSVRAGRSPSLQRMEGGGGEEEEDGGGRGGDERSVAGTPGSDRLSVTTFPFESIITLSSRKTSDGKWTSTTSSSRSSDRRSGCNTTRTSFVTPVTSAFASSSFALNASNPPSHRRSASLGSHSSDAQRRSRRSSLVTIIDASRDEPCHHRYHSPCRLPSGHLSNSPTTSSVSAAPTATTATASSEPGCTEEVEDEHGVLSSPTLKSPPLDGAHFTARSPKFSNGDEDDIDAATPDMAAAVAATALRLNRRNFPFGSPAHRPSLASVSGPSPDVGLDRGGGASTAATVAIPQPPAGKGAAVKSVPMLLSPLFPAPVVPLPESAASPSNGGGGLQRTPSALARAVAQALSRPLIPGEIVDAEGLCVPLHNPSPGGLSSLLKPSLLVPHPIVSSSTTDHATAVAVAPADAGEEKVHQCDTPIIEQRTVVTLSSPREVPRDIDKDHDVTAAAPASGAQSPSP